jgi:GTPase SAR1 family protein
VNLFRHCYSFYYFRLCKQELDEKYIPTIFDNHSITSVYNGQTYQIVLIDTAGKLSERCMRIYFTFYLRFRSRRI